MSAETCGYTVLDDEGFEEPCDRPATGWRWYQGHDHEDMLDAACDLHENEGGRRIHDAEAKVARVERLAALGPFMVRWIDGSKLIDLEVLTAALADA